MHFKKMLAVFLCFSQLILSESPRLQDYAEKINCEKQANQMLQNELSSYLYNLIDKKNVSGIKFEEYINEAEFTKQANQLTLAMNDGSFTTYSFAEDIKYLDENKQVKFKDTNIISQATSEGDFENGNNNVRIKFSKKASKGITLKQNNYKLNIYVNDNSDNGEVTKNQNKSKQKQNDKFVYKNAFGKDIDLCYTPQLNGAKQDIVLNKYTGKNKFQFQINTYGNIATLQENGTIEIIDSKTMKVINIMPAPYAYDATVTDGYSDNNHYTEDCHYSLNKISDSIYDLTVIVNNEFLTNKDTVYPVTIDPATSNLSTLQDAPVYSNYSTKNFGANQTNCTGKTTEYGYGRIYAQPQTPSIPTGSIINEAYYYLRENTGRTTDTYLNAYQVTSSWSEGGLTWSNKPSISTSALSSRNINSNSTDIADNPYWYKFNVTNAVANWRNGSQNYGLAFISNEETAGNYNWRAFASRENANSYFKPYLVVNYTPDTTAPTYSKVEIKNITATSYEVYVNGVSDDVSGVNKVVFPTWTATNGQDDLIWHNGINLGNGTWYYKVNKSDHNNETEGYITHIYMYDNSGKMYV